MVNRRDVAASLRRREFRLPCTPHRRGFSLVELLLTLGLVATLSAIVVPQFMDMLQRGKVAKAATDIAGMSMEIERFKDLNGRYPSGLADIGLDGMIDPWGNAYRYMKIEGVKGVGGMRKDRFLVPINSDFDLYSVGPDGVTAGPLVSGPGRDDVVRGNNGQFVGLASDF